MGAHTEYRPVGVGLQAGRLARGIAVLLVLGAFVAAGAYGGYLYGHAAAQRGDAETARQQAAALKSAVARAVAAKGAADHQIRLKIVARHVARQRRDDTKVLDRVLLREQQAGDRRAALAYERGRTEGRAVAARSATRAASRR